MKYYKLNNSGTKWIETDFNPAKRQIKLYSDDFIFFGIGLY